MSTRDFFSQFLRGELNPTDLAVYVTVLTKAENTGSTTASTTSIASTLGNQMSRHAVARSLRKLQERKLVTWDTTRGRGTSTITVR